MQLAVSVVVSGRWVEMENGRGFDRYGISRVSKIKTTGQLERTSRCVDSRSKIKSKFQIKTVF